LLAGVPPWAPPAAGSRKGMPDNWGRDYVLLALRIEKHVPGFVDGYYGPPDLKARVDAELAPRSVGLLQNDAQSLQASLAHSSYDEQRKQYLTRQLTGITTVLRRLAGQVIPFADEVLGCFDVQPERTDEAIYERALNRLKSILPGQGPVRERMIAWRRAFELPPQRLQAPVQATLSDLRKRTAAILPLPDGESLSVELVTAKPWSGYNWYLGNYRSRVEINTDLPVKAHALPALIAHEGYPGHHTEHAVKEALLWRAGDRLEHSILLINTPECLISEGIASLALECVIPESERAIWLRDVFFPATGLTGLNAEQVIAVNRATRELASVPGNAAFMLHADGRDRREVAAYLQHYGLQTPEEAEKRLSFLTNPLWRSYTFTYFYGERILRGWLDRAGWREGFRRLVSEPIYPSQLVADV
jgi:hypothetical protein